MKTIKIAFYKLQSKNSRKSQQEFEFNHFYELLEDLATKLDGDTNRQVIDQNQNGLETSIWFDCFNEYKYFKFENIYYFLLAKDVSSIMSEDKKNNKLSHQNSIENEIHLKIPAHFVYFPDKQILGVEEIENAPSKSIIEKAIKKHTKETIKFAPEHRKDVVERLNSFMDAIESVEFDMSDFSYLIKEIDEDDYLKFLNDNDSKIKIKTFLDTDESKKYVLDIFSKLFYKKAEQEVIKNISDMKINYKNDDSQQEALSLINNYLVFKKDRDIYLEEFQSMEDNFERRLKYSKSIYQTIIDFYEEYYE